MDKPKLAAVFLIIQGLLAILLGAYRVTQIAEVRHSSRLVSCTALSQLDDWNALLSYQVDGRNLLTTITVGSKFQMRELLRDKQVWVPRGSPSKPLFISGGLDAGGGLTIAAGVALCLLAAVWTLYFKSLRRRIVRVDSMKVRE